jgi:hypothetical protein
MGNFKLVFYGTQESGTHQHELTAYRNQDNDLFITIMGYSEQFIVMDVQTAVRFSREIKRVIAEMKEVSNG